MLKPTTHNLAQYALQALTPDQLLPYVQAVSNVSSFVLGNYLVHMQENHAVLVAYSIQEEQTEQSLKQSIEYLNSLKDLERITVLAPIRPTNIPSHITNISSQEDYYYFLDLPLSIDKLKNAQYMCKKATEHLTIQVGQGQSAWSGEHQELMLNYIRRPDVSTEMGSIFQRLGNYCSNTQQVLLFSAYDNKSSKLLGFTVGDFTSWQCAFYMFAMRHEHAFAGVADVLLWSLIQEAQNRGYSSCNLGLGINAGISFFKKKWGAKPHLPFVQTSWQVQAKEIVSPKKRTWRFWRN